MLIATIKFTKPIVGTKTQLVKLRKIPIRYPYIICYSVRHRLGKCLRKLKYRTCLKLNVLVLMP
jgi:hypothetical protein